MAQLTSSKNVARMMLTSFSSLGLLSCLMLWIITVSMEVRCHYYPPFQENAVHLFAVRGVVGFRYELGEYNNVNSGWQAWRGKFILDSDRVLGDAYYGDKWGVSHRDRFYGVTSVYVPVYLLMLIFSLLPIQAILNSLRNKKRARLGRCITCNYDLTGLHENRCPECSTEFDPKLLNSRTG